MTRPPDFRRSGRADLIYLCSANVTLQRTTSYESHQAKEVNVEAFAPCLWIAVDDPCGRLKHPMIKDQAIKLSKVFDGDLDTPLSG